MLKFNVLSKTGEIVGTVTAPNGELARQEASRRYPRSFGKVLMHPDALPSQRQIQHYKGRVS